MSSTAEFSSAIDRIQPRYSRLLELQSSLIRRFRRNKLAVDLSRPTKYFHWHPATQNLSNLVGSDGWLIKPMILDAFENMSVRVYPLDDKRAVLSRSRSGWIDIVWEYGQKLPIEQIDLVRYDNNGRQQVIFTESHTGREEIEINSVKVITLKMPHSGKFIEIKRRLNSPKHQGDTGSNYNLVVDSNDPNLFPRRVNWNIIMHQYLTSFQCLLTHISDTSVPFDFQAEVSTLLSKLFPAEKEATRSESIGLL